MLVCWVASSLKPPPTCSALPKLRFVNIRLLTYSQLVFNFMSLPYQNSPSTPKNRSRPLPSTCPVGWGCRIHRLHLCRGVRPHPNECPGYETKQSDGEVPAMLELWGMRSTLSLPLLPGQLWPGVVAPDKGPLYGLNRTKPCFFHYTDFCI